MFVPWWGFILGLIVVGVVSSGVQRDYSPGIIRLGEQVDQLKGKVEYLEEQLEEIRNELP